MPEGLCVRLRLNMHKPIRVPISYRRTYGGGSGDETDRDVVKLGSGNVRALRDTQSRPEGEGKRMKVKG